MAVRRARWRRSSSAPSGRLLLALPGVFYVWSMHFFGGTPIFMPVLHAVLLLQHALRPGALLPLLAACAPRRWWRLCRGGRADCRGALVVLRRYAPWLDLHPRPTNWVTWEESRVNSEARREWTRQAAEYLAPRYVRGSGIFTSFGDLTGIFRERAFRCAKPSPAITVCRGWPRCDGPNFSLAGVGRGAWPATRCRPRCNRADRLAACIPSGKDHRSEGRAGDRNLPAQREDVHGTLMKT